MNEEPTNTTASRLRMVQALGQEFERLLADEGPPGVLAGRRPLALRGRRAIVLALVGGLVATAAAGAATGIIRVGTEIPAGEPRGAPDYRMSVPETVVATGSSPVAGFWRLSAYESEGISREGQVLERQGMPCLRLMLRRPPAGTPAAGTGFCSARAQLNASSLPVFDSAGGEEILLFGHAPEAAQHVTLTGERGKKMTAAATPGPADFPGTAWVLVAEPGFETARIDWIDSRGKAAGAGLDVSREVASAGPAGRVAGGSAR